MVIVHNLRKLGLFTASAALCIAIVSCAPSHELKQVETRNPVVTYEYRGDNELLQAQQSAIGFCQQYGREPGAGTISGGSGRNVQQVSFECGSEPASGYAAGQGYGSDLTYSYRTDQDLLDASQDAEAYCFDRNARLAVSDIRNNSDGSKTIAFRCD